MSATTKPSSLRSSNRATSPKGIESAAKLIAGRKKTGPDCSGPVAGRGLTKPRLEASQTLLARAVFERGDQAQCEHCAEAENEVRVDQGSERKQPIAAVALGMIVEALM